MLSRDQSLAVGTLLEAYRQERCTPGEILELVLSRIAAQRHRHIWISCLSRQQLQPYVEALAGKSPDELPLYGIPFAIKDNIDLAGLPTTAACPDYAYEPEQHAFVVQRLIEAGAIPIGKTNLDQFATGLVGTRSPYGACENSFDPDYIAGGLRSAGPGEFCARHRHRRVRSGAGRVQQPDRRQTQPRPVEHPRCGASLPLAGLCVGLRPRVQRRATGVAVLHGI